MSTNQYRATSKAAIAAYGPDVVELDLSPADEADRLGSGVLALEPRPYRVLVDNYAVDGVAVPEGSVIEATYPREIEEALIGGGVLERARRDAHPTVDVHPDDEPAEADKPKRAKKAAPATTPENQE
jgi:hypothetical protein